MFRDMRYLGSLTANEESCNELVDYLSLLFACCWQFTLLIYKRETLSLAFFFLTNVHTESLPVIFYIPCQVQFICSLAF